MVPPIKGSGVHHLSLLLDSSGQSGQSGQMPPSGQAFALRLDYSESDKEELVKWMESHSTGSVFAVYEDHDGENPHVHVVLWSDKRADALRKSFKRLFPTKIGNGGYSLKPCDDDVEAYMRYMCKGREKNVLPRVIYRMGLDYTDVKIEQYHDQYWVNNDALMSNKRKRGELKLGLIEKIEKICKDEGVRKNDREGIAKIYIRLYRDARKSINTFAARAVVNTVQVLLDDTGEVMEDLARQIAGV